MDEQELIQKLKNGDERAFRLIVDNNQTSVLNCCFKFVKNREIAEDLTQDVFIEVFRSIGSFRSDAKLSTWIYRIAVSKSLDHLKSMNRKKRFAYLKSIFAGDEAEDVHIPSDAADPEELLEQEERRAVLSMAIESLPDNQKAAFTLSKYNEMSYAEIADILRTTVPSVESLIFRAKTNLKKKLYTHYKNQLI